MKHLKLTSKHIPVKAASTPYDPYTFKKTFIGNLMDALGINS